MSVEFGQIPPVGTLLGIVDSGARASMSRARDDIAVIVASETPSASGEVAKALKPRLSKTATGAGMTVGASRARQHGQGPATIADVVRWVNRGTGKYRQGPGPKSRIRAKNPLRRMVLPGGRKVWSVAGQHANPFIARIRAAGTPIIQREAEEGARQTARAVERAIG